MPSAWERWREEEAGVGDAESESEVAEALVEGVARSAAEALRWRRRSDDFFVLRVRSRFRVVVDCCVGAVFREGAAAVVVEEPFLFPAEGRAGCWEPAREVPVAPAPPLG